MPPDDKTDPGGVEVRTERQSAHGWVFEVRVAARRGRADLGVTVEVALSWVDYEYWSHGAASPSRVAEAVVRAVLTADPERELPARFDASTARRWVAGLDRRVREAL